MSYYETSSGKVSIKGSIKPTWFVDNELIKCSSSLKLIHFLLDPEVSNIHKKNQNINYQTGKKICLKFFHFHYNKILGKKINSSCTFNCCSGLLFYFLPLALEIITNLRLSWYPSFFFFVLKERHCLHSKRTFIIGMFCYKLKNFL